MGWVIMHSRQTDSAVTVFATVPNRLPFGVMLQCHLEIQNPGRDTVVFPLSGLYLLLAVSDHRSCLMIAEPTPGTCDGRGEPGPAQPGGGRSSCGLDVHEHGRCLTRGTNPAWGSAWTSAPADQGQHPQCFYSSFSVSEMFPRSLQTFPVCSQRVTGQVWCLCTTLMEVSAKRGSFAASEKPSRLTWPVSSLLGQMAALFALFFLFQLWEGAAVLQDLVMPRPKVRFYLSSYFCPKVHPALYGIASFAPRT